MKKVQIAKSKPCDICQALNDPEAPPQDQRAVSRARYNSPLTAEARGAFGGSWANLCGVHFAEYGIDTRVTEKFEVTGS